MEDKDIVHETIESFCLKQNISSAIVQVGGGIDQESILVVGPENRRAKTIIPLQHEIIALHEVTGTGTVFLNKEGKPILHLHIACGRKDKPVTGCIQRSIIT